MEISKSAQQLLLAFQIEASLSGHHLSPFQRTPNERGYTAKCYYCQRTIWIGTEGASYDVLGNIYPKTPPAPLP